jgi:membrane-bound lytic murein transglycosylase D
MRSWIAFLYTVVVTFNFGLAGTYLVQFCDLEIHLEPALQESLQKEMERIQANPLYFQKMVERASMHLPVIRDAFRHIGVPEDLVYLAIQESGLRGNAVSSSMAVGYWQLKDFTAREVGLRVDETIDERRHLFRSSIAAARYLYKQWLRYENWLYAVIAYYEGGSGAEPHTDPKYYGAKRMELHSLHWYALRALAFKLVYEQALHKRSPSRCLTPHPLPEHQRDLSHLLKELHIPEEEFKEHNGWWLKTKIPADYPISYYTVEEGKEEVLSRMEDPYKHLFQPPAMIAHFAASWTKKNQETHTGTHSSPSQTGGQSPNLIRKNPLPPSHIAVFYVEKEPYYGTDFVIVKPNQTLEDIAATYQVSVKKLRRWNQLSKKEAVKPGTYLLLKPPRKVHVHITGPSESLADIALKYRKKVEKLIEYNRFPSDSVTLYTGQKIYLRSKKPYDEKLIIYSFDPESRLKELSEKSVSTNERQRNFIEYEVKQGDTLWSIAKRYGVHLQELMEINQIKSPYLQVGMRLKIPVSQKP